MRDLRQITPFRPRRSSPDQGAGGYVALLEPKPSEQPRGDISTARQAPFLLCTDTGWIQASDRGLQPDMKANSLYTGELQYSNQEHSDF